MVRALAQQPAWTSLLSHPAHPFSHSLSLFPPPSPSIQSPQPGWGCPRSGKQGSNPFFPVVRRPPRPGLFVFELRSLPCLQPGLAGLLLAWLPPSAQVGYDPLC